MYIVSCVFLDAPKFPDRCFETFRCKSLKDVNFVISEHISKKRHLSVRIADPCEENVSSWPLIAGVYD